MQMALITRKIVSFSEINEQRMSKDTQIQAFYGQNLSVWILS